MSEPRNQTDLVEDQDDAVSEYEYAPNETETFYVILDLSSFAPPKPFKPTSTPVPAPAAEQMSPNVRTHSPTEAIQEDATRSITPPQQPEHSGKDSTKSVRQDRIQFLDLPTEDPLVLYQGQTYSCTWGSTIGTDFIIGAKEPIFDTTYDPPIPSEPEAELIGLSTTRLTARPVQATLKPKASSPVPADQVEATAFANDGFADKAAAPRVDPGPSPSRARKNQADFLQQLMDIKAAKGESDTVLTSAPPWNKKPDVEAPARVGGRGRGRGKGKAGRKKGGMLRSYKLPQGSKAENDTRDKRRKTPVRWADLEQEIRPSGDGANDGKIGTYGGEELGMPAQRSTDEAVEAEDGVDRRKDENDEEEGEQGDEYLDVEMRDV